MGHVRVGVARSVGKQTFDGPPQWIEIAGVRLPDDAGVFSIEHKAVCDSMCEVTIKLYSGGYETVAANG